MKKLQVYIGNKNIYVGKIDGSASAKYFVDNVFYFFPEATHAVIFDLKNNTQTVTCKESNIDYYKVTTFDGEELCFSHLEAALNSYRYANDISLKPRFEVVAK